MVRDRTVFCLMKLFPSSLCSIINKSDLFSERIETTKKTFSEGPITTTQGKYTLQLCKIFNSGNVCKYVCDIFF